MDEVSNKTLALLLVAAMVISLGATIYTLDSLDKARSGAYGGLLTGRATTDTGNVTVNVQSAVSIVLRTSIVNFGSGFVNTSNCQTNATLSAALVYNDTDNAATSGGYCWTNYTAKPTSLQLENDGNRNVTLDVRGPTEQSFFNNYAGSDPYNLTWRARQNETESCPRTATFKNATFQTFNGTNTRVCTDFLYAPSNDQIAIDIRLQIPATNLPTGTYENASIVFTAAAS